jgi:beta-glucanase (GH16 family)
MTTTTGTPAFMYPTQQDGHPGTQDPSPYSLLGGGGLEITLNYYSNLTHQGAGIIYSGDISTVDQNGTGFSQMYGYWEVSAKFPSGTGVWPAIWMFPANVAGTSTPGGEIDIQEGHSIAGTPTQMAITLHDWTSTNEQIGFYSINEPTEDTYHVYGMLWTAQTMTFYFDNQQVWQIATPAVMNTPYYLILDLGLGSGWPAGVGITPFPQDMLVQYVRVYKAP